MGTLLGRRPSETYGQMLRMETGIVPEFNVVQDGAGHLCPLFLSTDSVKIVGNDSSEPALRVTQSNALATGFVATVPAGSMTFNKFSNLVITGDMKAARYTTADFTIEKNTEDDTFSISFHDGIIAMDADGVTTLQSLIVPIIYGSEGLVIKADKDDPAGNVIDVRSGVNFIFEGIVKASINYDTGEMVAQSFNGDGPNITGLDASNIAIGTVGTARLGTGTANSTTFLRGDNTWQTVSIPSAANPTASIGLTANNGSATTFMRSDGTPALGVGIVPTWTGQHVFNSSSPTVFRKSGGTASIDELQIDPSTSGTIILKFPKTSGGIAVRPGNATAEGYFQIQNHSGTTISYFDVAGGSWYANAFTNGSSGYGMDSNGIRLLSTGRVGWQLDTAFGAVDTALVRSAAGVVKVTNGSSGYGSLTAADVIVNGGLNAGTGTWIVDLSGNQTIGTTTISSGSIGDSGSLTIDANTDLLLGPGTSNILIGTVGGPDISFFGVTPVGQAAAPDSGGSTAARLAALEAMAVGLGFMAAP